MKKLLLNLFLLALTVVGISSCSEDDNGPKILLPKLDGVYVYGTNTIAAEPTDPLARMAAAPLNPAKSGGALTANGYYGKLMYIGANSTINIVEIDGSSSSIFGSTDGGSVTNGTELPFTDIDAEFVHGDLIEDGSAIEVTEEGLYYLFVNTVDGNFRMMKIEPNMIGDATPGDWASSTAIPMIETSATETVFELTDVALLGAHGYKLRFNKGYEVYNDNTIATLTFLGVEDYGVAWDTGINDLGYWDVNIPNKEGGYYTFRLAFDAATGTWTETKTKTGELLVDYSGYQFGWFGNAYYVEGDTEGAWNAIHHIKLPVKTDNLYNWSWELELIEGRSFVLREDKENGAWITYGGAGKVGTAFDNGDIIKEDGADNYFVAKGGVYTITFTINAEDDGRTLTIEPN